MFSWFWQRALGAVAFSVGVGALLTLALLFFALAGPAPTRATMVPPHPAAPHDSVYSWSRLYDTASSWDTGGVVYDTDMQVFGPATDDTPVILAGWAQGSGYVIFTVGGLGDPVYVSYPGMTEFHVVVDIPPMTLALRRLEVTARLTPDKNNTLVITGPNILIGQPLLPLPQQ